MLNGSRTSTGAWGPKPPARLGTAVSCLAILLTLGLASAGCVADKRAEPPVNTVDDQELSPLAALAAAATISENQSFRFTMFGEPIDIRYSGTHDSTGNILTDIQNRASVLVIGSRAYIKLSPSLVAESTDAQLKALAGKWVQPSDTWLARSFLSFLLPAKRAMTPGAYLNGVIEAERTTDGRFSGSLDIGKSTPTVFAAPNCLPDNHIVPFVATLDGDHRLSEIVLSLDQVRWVTRYSDFGVSAEIRTPASDEIVDAPLAFYKFFGETGCAL